MAKKISVFLFLFFSILGFADKCKAEQPDFFLLFKECSSVIGYLHQLDFPLKTFKVGGIKFECTRKSKKFLCNLSFEDGGKPERGNPVEYDLAIETGNILDIQLPNGADYIVIDRNAHTAALVSRQADMKFLGAKTCRGIFLTADEAAHLNKKDEQKKLNK